MSTTAMTGTEPEVLRVGDHGPIFELVEPHTVATVRAGADEQPHWLCRFWRHKRRVVGRTFRRLDNDSDLSTAVLAMVAEGGSTKTLMRCERCGAIEVRSGA